MKLVVYLCISPLVTPYNALLFVLHKRVVSPLTLFCCDITATMLCHILPPKVFVKQYCFSQPIVLQELNKVTNKV